MVKTISLYYVLPQTLKLLYHCQIAEQNQVIHYHKERPTLKFHHLRQKLRGIKHQHSKTTFPSQNYCP